ncbi:MAG: diphthamide biosynthesis enzyme Dph2 [Candidatus Bathyarchaeia archaeon]
MPSSTFDIEEKRLIKEIKDRKARLVLIQLPEGLKPLGPKLAAAVEETGAIAIISADPCYGACDLATIAAEKLGADLIVHYGHSEMLKQTAFSTVYIEAKAKTSVRNAVKKAILYLEPWKKIGLVTTIQHVHKLDEAKHMLLKAGKTVALGDAGRLAHAGQVIGCDYSNARAVSKEVEAFLFVGGGIFHALGVALATAKPTIVADPYEKRAFTVDDQTKIMLKKRWATIQEAKQAQKIGILIGLKAGQKRLDQSLKMKKLVEKSGRVATLFTLGEITPEILMQFPTIDVFINTACPRISMDDAERFNKPVLTPNEMLVALDKLQWEELCKSGWFES